MLKVTAAEIQTEKRKISIKEFLWKIRYSEIPNNPAFSL